MFRDEISRKDLKFKLKAQALNIGSGGGDGEGTTLGSVATLPLMTEEQIEAVRQAITSWGSDYQVGTFFIPATSVDGLPLHFKIEDAEIAMATFAARGEFEDAEVVAYTIPPRETRNFVRVDGGYGEYFQQKV